MHQEIREYISHWLLCKKSWGVFLEGQHYWLELLENGKVSEIAVERIGFNYNIADDAVGRFLQWVLENGTKYNHKYGLLNLDKKETSTQINKVQSVLTAHLESLGKGRL